MCMLRASKLVNCTVQVLRRVIIWIDYMCLNYKSNLEAGFVFNQRPRTEFWRLVLLFLEILVQGKNNYIA